jgi:hypothetical protein
MSSIVITDARIVAVDMRANASPPPPATNACRRNRLVDLDPRTQSLG